MTTPVGWVELLALVYLADLTTPWEVALGAVGIHIANTILWPPREAPGRRRVIQSPQKPGERSGPAPKDTDHESPVHS